MLLRKRLKSLGRRSQQAETQVPAPAKLVGATRILDEADIVEAFVRHSAAYVDHHIFADNGSNDGTLEILNSLKQEGIGISVIRNASVSYCETVSNTKLYHEAVQRHDADWVLFLDADEFIDDRGLEGGLRAALERLRREAPHAAVVDVPLTQYHARSDDDPEEINVARRIVSHSGVTDITKVIVSASLASREAKIANGSHRVLLPKEGACKGISLPSLTYAHFSERSPAQYVAKFVKGWAKVLAAGSAEVAKGTSNHYRDPFHILRDRPQDLLRDPHFLGFRNEHLGLHRDPIAYRGGDLRHTSRQDEPIRAVRSLMGYLHDLAVQHGRLIEESREARRLVERWNSAYDRIL